MRNFRRLVALGGAAGLALGATPAGAVSTHPAVTAQAEVSGRATVPVSVGSASVTLRPTTVYKVSHPGTTVHTPAIPAGSQVEVAVKVRASVDAGAVTVTVGDLTNAITPTHNGSCIGIGVNFGAAVVASGNARAAVYADVVVKVNGAVVVAKGTGEIVLNAGPINERIPVQTGADVCAPEVDAGPVSADVKAIAEGTAKV